MHEVYSGAVLTIVAANSPSIRGGIFSQRSSESSKVVLEWKTADDSRSPTRKVYLWPGPELWNHTLQSSPLMMSRGWAFQEGLLAPRTLSYRAQ